MTTYITNPRSMRRSVRMAFAVGSLAVFAGCSSTTHSVTRLSAVVTATTTLTTEESTANTVGPTTTQPPATTATPATTPDTAATPTSTVTRSTVAPTMQLPVPEPTTTVATSSNAVPGSDPIAAIDGNGDAVLVDAGGTATVLYDGTDPDDPAPWEGPRVLVVGVAVTNDLTTGIVATCCEPSPGTLIVTNSADPAKPQVGFGRSPVISPDQKQLAVITDQIVVVSWLDLSAPLHSAELRPLDAIADIVWADDTHVIALVVGHTYAFLNRYLVTDEGLVETASGGGPLIYSLVGVSDGVLYALTGGNIVAAFAADTLAPLPERDITLSATPTSASMHDGELRWVDQERHLHIGDRIVAGEYTTVA